MLQKKMIAAFLSLAFIATTFFETSALAVANPNASSILGENGDTQKTGEQAAGNAITIGSGPENSLNLPLQGLNGDNLLLNGIPIEGNITANGQITLKNKELVVAVVAPEKLEAQQIPLTDAIINNSKLESNDAGKMSVENIRQFYLNLDKLLHSPEAMQLANSYNSFTSFEMREAFTQFRDSLKPISLIWQNAMKSSDDSGKGIWSSWVLADCKELVNKFREAYKKCLESNDPYIQDVLAMLQKDSSYSAYLKVLSADDWSLFDGNGEKIGAIQVEIGKAFNGKSAAWLKNAQFTISDGEESIAFEIENVWAAPLTPSNGFLCDGCGSNPCKCVVAPAPNGVPVDEDIPNIIDE